MVKIIESYTAPNPKEYTYWVDLTSNPIKVLLSILKVMVNGQMSMIRLMTISLKTLNNYRNQQIA